MDGLQENKLIAGIKQALCARIDECRHDIIRDYERAEKEAEKPIKYPISAAVKFCAFNGKAAIQTTVSWGVKRKSEDACEISIGRDLVDQMREGAAE